jgi:predicted dehydrogenase
VEKPLVTGIKSMSELCQYAEDNKILIYTSFQRRFNVYFNKISNIIKKKYIGDIIYCNLNNIHSKSEEYYIKKGKGKYDGGGVLINQAIHSIDMLLVLFENIEVNSAYLKCMTHDINCEDWAKVDMNSKETNISFWATTSAYREQGYELAIWGTNGHIKFSNNHFEYEYKKNNIIYSEEKEYFFSNIDLLTSEYGDIYEEITNDGFISEKLCKYETGLESIKIIEKVYNMVIKNE